MRDAAVYRDFVVSVADGALSIALAGKSPNAPVISGFAVYSGPAPKIAAPKRRARALSRVAGRPVRQA